MAVLTPFDSFGLRRQIPTAFRSQRSRFPFVLHAGLHRRHLPGFLAIASAFLLFLLAVLSVPRADAQYLFNEQLGNKNPISMGTVKGYSGTRFDATWAVAAADFNGDGRTDIAVILETPINNSEADFIQTYLGQPDGSYKLSSSTQFQASQIAVGDVNGDGIPDIVVLAPVSINNGPTIAGLGTLLGNGDGTFQNPVISATQSTESYSLVLGDFNRDGKLDAVVGDVANNKILVYLGDGTGSFTAGATSTLQDVPQQIVAADMNHDGKMDLVVAEQSQVVSVLLGNGDGTFQPELANADPNNAYNLAVADLNGDGIPDVVTSGNELEVFLGNGDGTLESPTTTEVAGNIGAMITGDFNGDGIPDIAMEGGWTGIVMLFGNGDGTFKTPGSVYGNSQMEDGGTYGPALAAGDFNNDGKLDLVTAPYNDGSGEAFAILANNGDGTFAVGGDLSAGYDAVSTIVADFNGDGIPDLAIANINNNDGVNTGVRVYLGAGKGKFGNAINVSLNDSHDPLSLVAGDFNRDGKIDLASANYDGTVSVLFGNGDGTFASGKTYAAAGSGTPLQLATGDLNGDGNLDLAVLYNVYNGSNGYVAILLGNGDGSFQAPQTVNTGLYPNASFQLADADGDGKLDILVNGNSDVDGNPTNLYLLRGNGDGTFQAGVQALPMMNAQGTPNPEPNYFGAANLRGNGVLDIVTTNSLGMQVWPGNGDGTYGQPITNWGTGDDGTHFVFGDFNGDGKTDLAMCGYNSAIWVSLGNGDDTFGPQSMYNIPRTDTNDDCESIVAGDFNGDGSLDLAGLTLLNGQDGTLTTLLSNPVLAFSHSSIAFPNTNIGSTSGGIILSVTNQSYTPLAISGISMAGANASDFTETNNCGASLAGGASCQVTVAFTPVAAGLRKAAIEFNDSSAGSPQEIAVSGVAPGPGATLSAQALTFATQRLGTSSAAQTVTLTNSGTTTLTIASIAASGDFSQSSTCGTSLAAGSSCSMSVVFAPTADGSRSGTLTVSDGAHGSPQTVQLTGTGASSEATFTPAKLTFPSQAIGTPSVSRAITVTNSGTLTLNIASIAITGDYSETNTCVAPLAAGQSCLIDVVFTPTSLGTRSGSVTVKDDAPDSPQGVTLSGTGTTAVPAVTLSPTSLTFAAQNTGSTSAAQTVKLSNTGTAVLNISSIAASGDFAETNNCGTTLAPAGSCTISVTFTPTAGGTRSGTLTITDNAAGSPHTVALSGTGATVSITPPSAGSGLSVSAPGSSATATLQLGSAGGFSGTVNLACAVAYTGTGTPNDPPTCSLNPNQETVPAGGTANVTLTVNTTGATSSMLRPLGGGAALATLAVLFLIPRRRLSKLMLLLVLGLAAATAFTACGGGSGGGSGGGGNPPSNPGTTTGSYNVTVTATSGTMKATATIPLTVQ